MRFNHNKKEVKKRLKLLWQQHGREKYLVLICLFAAVGTILLLQTHAATSVVNLEPETAVLSGSATVGASTQASNGHYVTFGQATAAGTGKFYVVGKDIIDPDGNIFYPMGANAAIKLFDYSYVFEGNNGGANQHIQEIRDWHWNTIRATLVCDNDSGTPSFTDLVNGLKQEIPKLTAQKIVVMLECHDFTGQNPTLGSAKEQNIRRFWGEMAADFKDNPYVWFDFFNEPWAGPSDANYVSLYNTYINVVRSAGAQNIVVATLPTYGQGLEELATGNLGATIAGGKCNVMFGWHAYGAYNGHQGSFSEFETALQQVRAKNFALVVGEYGIALPQDWGNAGPWEWNVSGFNYMSQLGPQYGVGLLWWHATGDSSIFSLYALKNDRTGYWSGGAGANLTPPGQTFWNVSQAAQLNLGKFTGNLAASNCPGA